MGVFRRLFSADYRKAVAAEAQGDFITAARHYGICGDTSKVADMHLAQARAEASLDDRARALRTALNFVATADSRRSMVLRLLGRTLRERALAAGTDVESRRGDLEEAAALLEEGEAWESAGDCYLALGDRNRAATAYARVGLVEKVEEVLGQQERDRERSRREDTLFRDHEMLLSAGQRDEAVEALRGCIEAAERKGDYRRVLAELEPRLLSAGRVTLAVDQRQLTFVGHFPLVLGREGDCDLQTRGASVSRRHAHILFEPDRGFCVADCGSRNGTQLNGLTIGATLPLPPNGTIGLGESCKIQFTVRPDPPALLLLAVAEGLDRGREVMACSGPCTLDRALDQAPPLELAFQRGRPFIRARRELKLNGALVGTAVQLIGGDTIELDGKVVRVVG
jgi:tetratricopeptide (TPR) repeat protein